MPSLKQLTCHVERGAAKSPLHEYATAYGDGIVTSYLEVPNRPTAFQIHLTSNGFIAHGLAMFVFIDGKPQCNRNQHGLIIPSIGSDPGKTEIDFQVSRREARTPGGKWVGRPWRFEKLNTVEADNVPNISEHVKWNTGTIEVIVLRCDSDTPRPSTGHLPERRNSITNRPASRGSRPSSFQTLPRRKRNRVRFNLRPEVIHNARVDPPEIRAPSPVQKSPLARNKSWFFPKINLFGPVFESAAERERRGYKYTSTGLQRNKRGKSLKEQKTATEDDEPYAFSLFDQLDGASDAGPVGVVINQYGTRHDDQGRDRTSRRRARDYNSSQSQQAYWQPPYPFPPPMQPAMQPSYAYAPMPPHGHQPMPLPEPHMQPYYPGPTYFMGYPYPNYQQPYAQGLRQTSGQSSNKGPAGNNDSNNTSNGERANTNNAHAGNDNGDNWANTENDNGGNNNDNWDSNDNDNRSNNNDNWDNNDNDNEGNNNDNWDNNDNAAQEAQHDWGTSTPAADANSGRSRSSRASNNNSHAASGDTADYRPVDPKRPHIKAYWSYVQPPAVDKTDDKPRGRKERRAVALERANSCTEERVAPLPATAASQAQLSHALQPGSGALFSHGSQRPKYIDSMDRPYAVFCFKYRSGERLREILGEDLGSKEDKIERGIYKDKMMALSKEDVLDELIRAKKALDFDTNSSLDDDLGFSDSAGGEDEKTQSQAGSMRNGSVKNGKAKATEQAWGSGGSRVKW